MDNEAKANILQYIDGIPIQLKEPFDFNFLRQYGTVFKIYDTQSSGNLCFGCEKEGKRYFIKFAGAKTINDHDLPVEDAIARLNAAVIKYKELSHPSLIRLIKCIYRNIRTAIPETSGHETGCIRTLCRLV